MQHIANMLFPKTPATPDDKKRKIDDEELTKAPKSRTTEADIDR